MEWCEERGQHCWLTDCSFQDAKFDQQQEYGFWVSVWQQMPCEESNVAVVGGGEYNTWLPSCARQTWNQEPTNDLLFWAGGADSCKPEDYCDPPMPTEAFDLVEEQQEDGFLSFKAGMQLLEEDGDLACGLSSDKALNALYATVLERAQALDLAAVTDHDISHLCGGVEQQQPDYPVPTFAEGNKCCAMSVKADQLKAAIEEQAVKDEGTPSLHKNANAAAEQSIALAARVPHSDAEDAGFLQEFDARLDGDWVIVGRGGDHQQDSQAPPAAAATLPPVSPLKPALKPAAHHHRPAPLRRPSNPLPATITEGPTPKNADDADQTCDNFRLFWEKDPALKTPKVESATDHPAAAAGAVPAMAKSVSFKDKKSAQCLIYVEPEKHVETEEELQKLDDDRHTFDNFDRLWENDPHFIGMIAGTSSRAEFQDKIVHELEESAKSNTELLKVDASDMIQKHLVNIVNSTSSSSAKEETQKWCKSNIIYDPLTKTDRRFSFEFLYEIRNQNEEEGTADKTIRNAAVVLRFDVQVQVVLKVEPMQDPERKFLYNFNHNVKVLSDFKLETKARLLHTDITVTDEVPEQFREPGLEVTHHKVTNYISILHRWATVTTPRNKPSVLQRRMSASSSHSLAHQDLLQQQQQQQQQVVEEQMQEGEGEEGTAAGGKALRRSRSRQRSHPYQQLQRSNSK